MAGNPYPTLPGSAHEIQANNQSISMFRASPWVTYEPTTAQDQLSDSHSMDHDVDMDAPQISTLREEETPPPQPASKSGTRRKKAAPKVPPAWTQPRRRETHTDEEYDEVEEEEDQLIDDNDDEMMKPVPPAMLPPSGRSDASSKRRTGIKRKPRKSEKRVAEDERKAQEKSATLSLAPPTMTWFEATPSEIPEEPGSADMRQISIGGAEELSKASTPKKTRKPAAPRTKKVFPKVKTVLPILADDTGVVSEGYTGTAASSPVTVQFETNSPEPEATGSLASVPPIEETNLENVPLPQYPLPTKPFPVQPPPKIPTGFAPVLPLDRSSKKVRHWRVAQREIRGIAGGRWFTRAWVGSKDSEYAAYLKGGEDKAPTVAVPRLLGMSISAPAGKKGKAKAVSSLAASAAPSRSGSSIPDVPSASVRAPTKMRTIIAPPSEAGDSDMAAPPES